MSDVLERDLKRWEGFSPGQKAAAVAVNLATLARPVAATWVAFRIARAPQPTWGNTVGAVTTFASDLDGKGARAADVVTEFGAIADPLADKASMTAIEIASAKRRGWLAKTLLGLRVGRDVAVTTVRRHDLNNGGSGDGVKANGLGKASTSARMTLSVISTSPLGERHPRLIDAADVAVTALTLFSGFVTIKRMRAKRAAKS